MTLFSDPRTASSIGNVCFRPLPTENGNRVLRTLSCPLPRSPGIEGERAAGFRYHLWFAAVLFSGVQSSPGRSLELVLLVFFCLLFSPLALGRATHAFIAAASGGVRRTLFKFRFETKEQIARNSRLRMFSCDAFCSSGGWPARRRITPPTLVPVISLPMVSRVVLCALAIVPPTFYFSEAHRHLQ